MSYLNQENLNQQVRYQRWKTKDDLQILVRCRQFEWFPIFSHDKVIVTSVILANSILLLVIDPTALMVSVDTFAMLLDGIAPITIPIIVVFIATSSSPTSQVQRRYAPSHSLTVCAKTPLATPRWLLWTMPTSASGILHAVQADEILTTLTVR